MKPTARSAGRHTHRFRVLTISGILTLTISCSLHAAGAGCKKERELWQVAETQDTVEAYAVFVATCPTGQLAQEALERMSVLAWDEAQAEDTPDGYADFMDGYPDSEMYEEARARFLAFAREEVKRQKARLVEYKVGNTSREEFNTDRWNAEDPWLGRIGIVLYTSGPDTLEVTLGIQPTIGYADAEQSADALSMVKRVPGGKFSALTRVSREDPTVLTKIVCALSFQGGLLESKECNFEQ